MTEPVKTPWLTKILLIVMQCIAVSIGVLALVFIWAIIAFLIRSF